MKLLLLLCFLLAGCAIGTTTTSRPALTRPVIGPDGAFRDATEAARRNDAEALRFLLSNRFVHEALLPRERREEPETVEAFQRESDRLAQQLLPHQPAVRKLLDGYMHLLRELTQDRFIEVGRPNYDIRYRDDFGRADGPNRASLEVQTWPKTALGPDPKPAVMTVRFIQDRQRWVIDDLEPNPLKGAYTR